LGFPKILSAVAGLIYSGCERQRESERERKREKWGVKKGRSGEANLFVFLICKGASALQIKHINICGLFYTVYNI
jgi:hypothetical protein